MQLSALAALPPRRRGRHEGGGQWKAQEQRRWPSPLRWAVVRRHSGLNVLNARKQSLQQCFPLLLRLQLRQASALGDIV